ncbi:MarR family transcriptional regulator [Hydrogenophaga taeniospiralis CCUG 15921]|uniref:MarR family transcriptional regulator n=1 Tax=Hydrogenophaga taeniospiralis CCUG 15921 TaxID=1281780 RepID=A0A9X4S8N8_9BURK|nr:MarR family transcriptional regulator [Hydrogenophaga taeniospiralis]MDG5976652.1 MarR family transcriptional regulator [Hydrogenophaga taeniospiralis CCUG 15921]
MSITKNLPHSKTIEVRDACLCLHAQRAARVLARRFDAVFRPLALTNWQFSLLAALNRPEPPTLGEVVPLLATDRTSLTAMLKPLARRGLVSVTPDTADRRKQRLALTPEGHALLARAYPLWKQAHSHIESALVDADGLRAALDALAFDAGQAPDRPTVARPRARPASGRLLPDR